MEESENPRYRANYKDFYYCIMQVERGYRKVVKVLETNMPFDQKMYDQYNYFRTEEEAQKALKKGDFKLIR